MVASNTEERLEALIQAGMNVARLNFSTASMLFTGKPLPTSERWMRNWERTLFWQICRAPN